MKTIKEKASQIYRVSPEYRRFDQKFNMTRRSIWDWSDFGTDRRQNRIERMTKGDPGFSLKDWALHQAGASALRVAQTDMNIPNMGHSSWSKISATLPPGVERGNEDPHKMSQYIKKVAYLYGADLVGITRLDRRWVYSHWFDEETQESYPILFSDETEQTYQTPIMLDDRTQVIPQEMQNAIVIVVSMDKEGLDSAPTLAAMATVYRAYAQLGLLTLGIAEFIRGLGYHAIPMINDTALSVPLAIDAGLGQLGRHGLLITPSFGPRCRICKILTDLPVQIDFPIDFGVTAFCDGCRKCAEQCPVDAISEGGRSYEAGSISSNGGVWKWTFDAEKCRKYGMEIGTNCGTCIRVCPFNKGIHWFHSMVRWCVDNLSILNPFWVKMDDLFSYGKFKEPEKFFWSSS